MPPELLTPALSHYVPTWIPILYPPPCQTILDRSRLLRGASAAGLTSPIYGLTCSFFFLSFFIYLFISLLSVIEMFSYRKKKIIKLFFFPYLGCIHYIAWTHFSLTWVYIYIHKYYRGGTYVHLILRVPPSHSHATSLDTGFLRLIPSMLQASSMHYAQYSVYRDADGNAIEESTRGSAAPQKQEGCSSKRRKSDGAGAVSQSAYTELLVVFSMHYTVGVL